MGLLLSINHMPAVANDIALAHHLCVHDLPASPEHSPFVRMVCCYSYASNNAARGVKLQLAYKEQLLAYDLEWHDMSLCIRIWCVHG